jgi:pimeloyl-ACP methyl ester carboxylesterase
MPFATLKNTKTYYDVCGRGEPLVLIHGLSGNSSAWASLMPYLEKHFQVISYDMRGSGQTSFDNQAFNISDLADDIVELLNFLALPRAHILGHSMGGTIAQNFAARHPEKTNHLVILHSRVCNSFVTQRFWEGMINVRKKYTSPLEDLVEFGAFWSFSTPFLENPANIAMLKEWTAAYPYPQTVENFELQANALRDFDSRLFISKLMMPVLVISGSEDILTPAQVMKEFANRLPCATYLEQQNGAHCSTIETPEWLTEQLIRFLK